MPSLCIRRIPRTLSTLYARFDRASRKSSYICVAALHAFSIPMLIYIVVLCAVRLSVLVRDIVSNIKSTTRDT